MPFSWRNLAAVLSLAAMLSVAGCNQSDKTGSGSVKKRLILLTNGNSPFWDACRFGLLDGAKEFKLDEMGIEAVMEVNDGTPKGQIDKLRQFGTQSDIVAVAVSALTADNAQVAEEMKKLQAKGVHVICVDADVSHEKFRDARKIYIGTDNLKGGIALGNCGRELLKAKGVEKGSYVQFVGFPGSDNATKRMDGFEKSVGDDYTEADRMGDELDRTRARDNVRNAIRNHEDLVALVGIWSYNAPAIVDVVTQDKSRDKYVIVTFDAEPIAIKMMEEGKIDAMVVQNPYDMGFQAVKYFKAVIKDDQETIKAMFPKSDQPDGDLYDTGLKVVVPDSDSPLKKEMFEENVQFLTLGEFKAWLEKYNLKGS
jgi:ribose transport system substrate-binding protein